MKVIIFFMILFFACQSNAEHIINENKLTIQQAEMLVSVVMWHGTKNNPCTIFTSKDHEYDNTKTKSSRFLHFMVGCRASDGDIFYSVDLYTADVFDPITECSEIKNKKLKELQKKARLSIHLTDEKYKKIKIKGAECVD